MTRVDFARVNQAAHGALPDLCARWLPQGRRRGAEWISLNPRRADRAAGSFKINLQTGRWADFALPRHEAAGGDAISLFAYLYDLSQREAALGLGRLLGVL